jgi:hypothetical protein
MDIENHLVYIGNTVIFSAGIIAGYYYFYCTDEYVSNPDKIVSFLKGFEANTKSTTIVFLMMNVAFILTPAILHRNSPWKQPLYKNLWLLILTILNMIIIIAIFFLTKYCDFITLQ